ncbi:hypothetical protein FRC08_014413 [Ceratobasidium sp. 394]|nr:hypothetical protein FRC08_014413 [Ceratobasidium sp. 394]
MSQSPTAGLFAPASEPEGEMMRFALGLEVRDGINHLVPMAAAADVHPDLLKNVKRFAAAGLFSPSIAYYMAPTGAKRSKNLQAAIYAREPHLFGLDFSPGRFF